MTDPVLAIRGLRVEYPAGGRALAAVDGVDLAVGAGQRVGLVGESGSGKSTLALAAMRLLRAPGRIAAGEVRFEGRDLAGLDEADCAQLRGDRIAMVYQDPFTFLNPLIRIGEQIAETLLVHGVAGRAERMARTEGLLDQLGLRPATLMARKYPHQLSGGQRQRAVIAMALVNRPALLVADEPTTALDVTVQAQILRVLHRSIVELGASLLLISHDLAVVRIIADEVAVMNKGEIVEHGTSQQVWDEPQEAYTQRLLAAIPAVDGLGTLPGGEKI